MSAIVPSSSCLQSTQPYEASLLASYRHTEIASKKDSKQWGKKEKKGGNLAASCRQRSSCLAKCTRADAPVRAAGPKGMLLLGMCLKLADVSNVARPVPTADNWHAPGLAPTAPPARPST